MVFELLSAFAVACNVLQVADLGIRALVRAGEYKVAANGALSEHDDLHKVLQSFEGLNTDLQVTLLKQSSKPVWSAAEERLCRANEECLRLSKDFIAILDHLKIRDRRPVLENFRMSLKSLWYKEKILAMERSVSQARDNLNIALLVYTQ